ncbi:hypothetical protein GCM10008933_38170 [Paenibacillus motobuensis]|uniref:Uncharacterized protein n=1 Tax=Paenibacillus motobuensis TaxID=295324 RepID=A0ABP3IHH3_9BACL
MPIFNFHIDILILFFYHWIHLNGLNLDAYISKLKYHISEHFHMDRINKTDLPRSWENPFILFDQILFDDYTVSFIVLI